MSPQTRLRGRAAARLDPKAVAAAKRRFREIFPGAFRDPTYLDWEREYKENAHHLWEQLLGKPELGRLLRKGAHREIADRALAVYTRPRLNLLAMYETMALRDALKDPKGAARFGPALMDLVHGTRPFGDRLDRFTAELDAMPQRQSRLAKWPVATLYPFIADPSQHLLLKPNLIKRAAASFGFDLEYAAYPNARTYAAFQRFAEAIEGAVAAWGPRDRIDVQGFLWVVFSDEYADWPWD
jgi:hypothetical protein